MDQRQPQRGFTLVEVMIVVGIIAILAAVAIPAFMDNARKTKGTSEVNAMFAELAAKQERYKSDNSTYLAVPACFTSISAQAQAVTPFPSACSAAWTSLAIASPEAKLRCNYEVTIGAAATDPVPPTGCTLPTNPANGWYMIVATCNLDDDTAVNSQYVASSLDTRICKIKEGK